MSLSPDRTSMTSRPLNAATWDRWADGELTDAEQQDLLARLDLEPEHWRSLALAFVEAQSLRQFCRERLESPPVTLRVPQSPATVVRASRARGARTALVAATCLVAFAGGWWGHGHFVRPVAEIANAAPPSTFADPASTTAEVGAVDSSQRVETLRIGFANPDGEITQDVEVPVVEHSAGNIRDWLAQPLISDSERERLRRAGNDVREETELYQVTLEDGRHALVPIRNLTFERLGPSDFQ